MGNKVVSPFPSYDHANKSINPNDFAALKENYKNICRDSAVITLALFNQMNSPSMTNYIRKNVMLKLFNVIDVKKDGLIDFEEYVSAIALFRLGSQEDKLRFLFLMYEPVKGGYLTREQIRCVIVDAMVSTQTESNSTLEEWLGDLRDLSEGMVDTVLYQFAAQDNKIDFQEFVLFVQMDNHIQAYLKLLPSLLDF